MCVYMILRENYMIYLLPRRCTEQDEGALVLGNDRRDVCSAIVFIGDYGEGFL
jgi:hypothetical protein